MGIPSFGVGTFRLNGQVVIDSVRNALDVGYRAVDTAQIYGNEAEVGQAIAESGVARDELFITTKIWTDNYSRARRVLEDKKDVLVRMADELLVREVLDSDQVTRICQGLPLEPPPAPAGPPSAPSADEPRRPGLPQIVPPLKEPLPQQH